MRNSILFICIEVTLFGLGCNKQGPNVSKRVQKPFAVSENDGVVHELYRDITFDEFSPTVPSGSLDSVDFDLTIQDYAIAMVTAPRSTSDAAIDFTTIFVTDSQQKTVKSWSVALRNQGDKVRGLFLVPKGITSASTIRTPAKLEGVVPLPKKKSLAIPSPPHQTEGAQPKP